MAATNVDSVWFCTNVSNETNSKMKTLNLKLGSTLKIAGSVLLPAGTWMLTADVKRTNGALVSGLTTTLTVLATPTTKATHSMLVTATPAATATWPVGNLLCDLRFQDALGNVIHSPTFTIATEQAITDAA